MFATQLSALRTQTPTEAARKSPFHAVALTLTVAFQAVVFTGCNGSSGSGTVDAGSEPSSSTSSQPDPAPTDANGDYNLGSTSQLVIDQCMSVADKEMLSRINDVRRQPRACGPSNLPAASALSWHCTLGEVALQHSRDMGDTNFLNHIGSDGLSPGDRVTNAGYDWSAIAENIAAGQQSIEAVLADWLESAGHCSNIMGAAYTEFGSASYAVEGSDYPIYWTQVFAAPRR